MLVFGHWLLFDWLGGNPYAMVLLPVAIAHGVPELVAEAVLIGSLIGIGRRLERRKKV